MASATLLPGMRLIFTLAYNKSVFFQFPSSVCPRTHTLISSYALSLACRSGPVAVIPRAPYEFRHDIKYFNRDVRRAPVAKKVVTPEVRHAFVFAAAVSLSATA
jgi:hypothetical protein